MQWNSYPLDVQQIFRKYKAVKRQLQGKSYQQQIKIAILGGSTTAMIADLLAVFLMQSEIEPIFYEGDYNRYYEEVMFDNQKLQEFKPDIIYFHTTSCNLLNGPEPKDSQQIVISKLAAEAQRWQGMWEQAYKTYDCTIIQNNFELPIHRTLGNRDFADCRGLSNFILQMNTRLAEYAQQHSRFLVNDIQYQSAMMGLDTWHDPSLWYAYKYAMSYDALAALTRSITDMVCALYGKTKKCLVLDLDNTLWGGVIGDDGLGKIQIGSGTPRGEAYAALQQYIKNLQQRGIILAVCSKNNAETARQGFTHPDSQLQVTDFAAFVANWEAKDQNLLQIAKELNIGLDSMVFLDDNPVERELIRRQLPQVTVPEIGEDVVGYLYHLSRSGYFEPNAISEEDQSRSSYYQNNQQRTELASTYDNYQEFLQSLQMQAEIQPFSTLYLERIVQLINKTNQFNLTTQRYTLTEVESMLQSPNYVTLYGRLRDKFGDNGIVTVIAGECQDNCLVIQLWAMSCRVLKRDLEKGMFDVLVAHCERRGISKIQGEYRKSSKNNMVATHYQQLGFELVTQTEQGDSTWEYHIPDSYCKKNTVMEVYDETGGNYEG